MSAGEPSNRLRADRLVGNERDRGKKKGGGEAKSLGLASDKRRDKGCTSEAGRENRSCRSTGCELTPKPCDATCCAERNGCN